MDAAEARRTEAEKELLTRLRACWPVGAPPPLLLMVRGFDRPAGPQAGEEVLLRLGAAGLGGVHGELLDEGEQGERPTAVRDLGPEDGATGDKGPVEHDGNEGNGAQASQQEVEMGGEGGIAGSTIEEGIAKEATEALVGGTMSGADAGEGASEASEEKGATFEEGGAEAEEVFLLIAVPGEV